MFAYNSLPFSELEKRIGMTVLMSDVVGLITGVSDVLPPVGGNREPRRQVYITDEPKLTAITLWKISVRAIDVDEELLMTKQTQCLQYSLSLEHNGILSLEKIRS